MGCTIHLLLQDCDLTKDKSYLFSWQALEKTKPLAIKFPVLLPGHLKNRNVPITSSNTDIWPWGNRLPYETVGIALMHTGWAHEDALSISAALVCNDILPIFFKTFCNRLGFGVSVHQWQKQSCSLCQSLPSTLSKTSRGRLPCPPPACSLSTLLSLSPPVWFSRYLCLALVYLPVIFRNLRMMGLEMVYPLKITCGFLPRTWVQFPKPTWWLTVTCDSSSRNLTPSPSILGCQHVCGACTYTCKDSHTKYANLFKK